MKIKGLLVVHGIDLDRKSKPPIASGGKLRLVLPWKLDTEALTPLSYQYRLVAE